MSESRMDDIRSLPHGVKTRDELVNKISKHGSIAESEVLHHINRSASPPWTHNDFVNFFQNSDQMVFQVQNDRLFLAIPNSDSSDDGHNEQRSTVKTHPAVDKRSVGDTERRSEDLCRGMAGLGTSSTKDAERSAAAPSSTRVAPPGFSRVPSAAKKCPTSDSSSDEAEDNERGSAGGLRRRTTNGKTAKPAMPVARPQPGLTRRLDAKPFDSEDEEEEQDAPLLKTKEEVYKLANPRRRHYYKPNFEEMVSMDPDPANKKVPKIIFDSDDDNDDSSDSSSDTDPRSQKAKTRPKVDPPRQNGDSTRNVEPQESASDIRQSKPGVDPPSQVELVRQSKRTEAEPKTETSTRRASEKREVGFREQYFATKEDIDFKDSRERDPDMLLRSIMRHGEVSRDDAQTYLEYFTILEGMNIEHLTNGSIVAAVLALIEADVGGIRLREIRNDERIQLP